MNLIDLGYDHFFEENRETQNLKDFDIARVLIENKERYIVLSSLGELEAQITGKLRYAASSKMDFPIVGDWVAITLIGNDQAIIYDVIKRKSHISRKSIDSDDLQPIASNVDVAFITTSVDRDFNPNRIDRYLANINPDRIQPILLLTKTDLIDSDTLNAKINLLNDKYKKFPTYCISNLENKGWESFLSIFEKGKTYCFLGSSGVGKSTIINKLAGKNIFQTKEISLATQKGKHTTTHRELVVLENKGILIDTPGMREFGVTIDPTGIETTFEEIIRLAENCKFKDCTHTNEVGCAILKAIDCKELDTKVLESYQKLERERIRLEMSYEQKRKKDKKFGKMCKQIMAEKNKNRN